MKQLFFFIFLLFCVPAYAQNKTQPNDELVVNISPNPTSVGFVTITANKLVAVTVTNVIGTKIKNFFVAPDVEVRVDMSTVPNGIFMFSFRTKKADGISDLIIVKRVVVN